MDNAVIPGDKLCEAEEYLPGRGAYVDEEGSVRSKIVGTPKYSESERTVTVSFPGRAPGINVVGSVVYGRVFQIIGQFVLLQLFPYNTRRFRLVPPGPIGAIHISDIRKEFVEDIWGEFGIGDWVRARVKRIVKKFYPQLSTVGKEYGVIKAYCPYDRTPLVRRGAHLYCPRCTRTFKRKIAFDYGADAVYGEMEVFLDDLTIASLITKYLNEDERVELASFREDHPLEGTVHLFFRVKEGEPEEILKDVVRKALSDVKELKEVLLSSLS